MNVPQIRLTSLAHGGGCGCKLAPNVLQQLLGGHPATNPYKQLLVGIETGDDAAVWKQDDGTCIIATTDFFMPMVDDPTDFGRIAATNAISDVYAMGGRPTAVVDALWSRGGAAAAPVLEGLAAASRVYGVPLYRPMLLNIGLSFLPVLLALVVLLGIVTFAAFAVWMWVKMVRQAARREQAGEPARELEEST